MSFHQRFHGVIRRLYFSRISVIGAENLPASGPLLALCLHRNGAVDAFVYRGVLPQLVFMVKASLRRGLFGKLFFDGIEVVRVADGGRPGRNERALDRCAALLGEGGSLGIFPEGTSQLGPRHLPFRSGAARIALRRSECGDPPVVVPLGVHYECPWAFRSRVEVVVGPPVDLASVDRLAKRAARLVEVKRRFAAALGQVGVNFPDGDHQDLAQRFAYAATLGTCRGYFDALKAMERSLPPAALAGWRRLERMARGRRLWRHQGVPLFPLTGPWRYVLATALLALPVGAGALVNLPPLAVAWWAGRTFPDDRNVIALWRILTGVPVFVLWGAALLVVGLVSGPWWLVAAYPGLTVAALAGWYRLKKLAVVAWNGVLHRDLRAGVLAVHREVLAWLDATRPVEPDERELVHCESMNG